MTVPSEPYTQDAADDEAIEIPPIPVFVVKGPQRDLAPHFGAASVWQVPAAGNAIPILNRRPSRFRGIIRNNDAANGVILAETMAKAQQGQGYLLPAGQREEWKSQQPCYAAGFTVAVIISTLDEAYIIPDDES